MDDGEKATNDPISAVLSGEYQRKAISQCRSTPSDACLHRCGSDCICTLLSACNSNLAPNSNDATDDGTSTLDVDEIYQVLGRDILKSSLLDDIDLYLECDDDNCYVVPAAILPEHRRPVFGARLAQPASCPRIRISFPQQTESYMPTRFKCDKCSHSFTRDSLLRDHLFRSHAISDLFPCPQCAYKGQTYRLLAKHSRRKHGKLKSKNHMKDDSCVVQTKTQLGNNNLPSSINSEAAQTPKHGLGDGRGCLSVAEDAPLQTDVNEQQGVDITAVEQRDTSKKGMVADNGKQLEGWQGEWRALSACELSDDQINCPAQRTIYVEVICGRVPTSPCASALSGGVASIECQSVTGVKTSVGERPPRRTHTSQYVCTWPGCKRSMRDRFNLDMHYRTHSGERRLECEHCTYNCIQQNSLNWHRDKQHPKRKR